MSSMRIFKPKRLNIASCIFCQLFFLVMLKITKNYIMFYDARLLSE